MNILRFIFIIFSLSIIFNAQAGSKQTGEAKFQPEQITTFAKDVEKYAASKGARAFIIARVGQPEKDLPKGIEFTHTAVAVYSQITLENGDLAKGYAIYNLYQDSKNKDKSDIIVDYPVDFFWNVDTLKAGIIVPDEELQTRIIKAIANGNHKTLHNPKYSLVSNPFNNQYQNCTEHTLNLINSAIYQTTDMKELKANTKAFFKPQKVKTGRFKLALGSIFMDGIKTSDHKGRVKTTTFTSIARYLKDFELIKSATIFENKQGVELL